MKKHTVTALLTLALVVSISGWVTAQSAMRAKPSAIAMVDLSQVLRDCKQKAQMDEELQSAAEAVKQAQEEKKTQFTQLQNSLNVVAPGTPAYTQRQNEVKMAAINLRAWTEFQNQELAQEQALRWEALYKLISDSCADVAKENGYDLVLFKETEQMQYQNFQQLVSQMGARKVIWSDEKLDITELVLQKLNVKAQAK